MKVVKTVTNGKHHTGLGCTNSKCPCYFGHIDDRMMNDSKAKARTPRRKDGAGAPKSAGEATAGAEEAD